jgi:hypothetical protein
MFRHVVLITWKPDATEAQKGAVGDELGKLPGVIDAIRGYRFGPGRPAGQNASSGSSISSRVVSSTARRSTVSRGRTVCAKNRDVASLPW